MAEFSVFVLLSSVLLIALTEANELARGWGDGINWVPLDDGLKFAKDENKPLMLVIHKSWCGACKALKPKFAESAEIQGLSSSFVMVNTEDEEEPSGSQYSPDGGYIPRILFLDSSGDVKKEFYNKDGNPSYKYYYPDPADIAKTMRRIQNAVEDGLFHSKKDEL